MADLLTVTAKIERLAQCPNSLTGVERDLVANYRSRPNSLSDGEKRALHLIYKNRIWEGQ